MSSRTVHRLCSRPTAAASGSTNDCTPRLTRFTPQRKKVSISSAVSVPGAHSTVTSASVATENCSLTDEKIRSQLRRLEDRRRSTAQVNRVHFPFDTSAHVIRYRARCSKYRDTLDPHSARKQRAKKRQMRSCNSCTWCGRKAPKCIRPEATCLNYPTHKAFPSSCAV